VSGRGRGRVGGVDLVLNDLVMLEDQAQGLLARRLVWNRREASPSVQNASSVI
jgi:hypothetical protein